MKSEEEIEGNDEGGGWGKKKRRAMRKEMGEEKKRNNSHGMRCKEKRRLVERGRKTGLVVSTRRTLTSH